jgi:hypothetical protein
MGQKKIIKSLKRVNKYLHNRRSYAENESPNRRECTAYLFHLEIHKTGHPNEMETATWPRAMRRLLEDRHSSKTPICCEKVDPHKMLD